MEAYTHGKKLKLKTKYGGDQPWQRGTKYSCRRQSGGTTHGRGLSTAWMHANSSRLSYLWQVTFLRKNQVGLVRAAADVVGMAWLSILPWSHTMLISSLIVWSYTCTNWQGFRVLMTSLTMTHSHIIYSSYSVLETMFEHQWGKPSQTPHKYTVCSSWGSVANLPFGLHSSLASYSSWDSIANLSHWFALFLSSQLAPRSSWDSRQSLPLIIAQSHQPGLSLFFSFR